MKTLLVGAVAFIFMVLLFWLCGGFVSTVWNPMAWEGIGRFMLILCSFGIGGPIAVGAACAYHEEMQDRKRKAR